MSAPKMLPLQWARSVSAPKPRPKATLDSEASCAWARGFATGLVAIRPVYSPGVRDAMRAAGLTVDMLIRAGALPGDVETIRNCYPKEEP